MELEFDEGAADSFMEEMLTSMILKQQAQQMTALPCVVTQIYDDGNQAKVDVMPLVNILYKDNTAQERSQILGVPVVFPASRTSMLSFPVQVGDSVLCVMASRDIDNFKSGYGTTPTTPNDNRRMSPRDAIAIPGLFSFATNPINPARRKWAHTNKDLVISHNIGESYEVEIRLTPTGKLVINTEIEGVEVNAKYVNVNASESIALKAPSMTVDVGNTSWTGDIALSGNITHSGNYTIQGQFRFNGILIDTHIHSGVMAGPGNTGPVAG